MLVNRQHEIVARHRRLPPEQLHGPPRYVHLHLIAAVDAAHLLVVDALKTKLSDDVARLVAFILAAFQLLLVDLAHIAEYMRRIFSVDIVTDRQHLNHHTGVVVLLLLDDRDNIGQYVRFDTNRIEPDMRVNLLLNLRHRYIDEL